MNVVNEPGAVKKGEACLLLKTHGTPAFVGKQVAQALAPWPELLPTIFAFHVGVGWQNARRTLEPVLGAVNDVRRPPFVWLFGPVPRSVVARDAIRDWLYYFFDLRYGVRWTSCCGACDAGTPHHTGVFSILACLADERAHCASLIKRMAAVSFAEYNASLNLCEPRADGARATRMEEAVISNLQLRTLFGRLLFGDSVEQLPAWRHFFRAQRFVSMESNVCSLFGGANGGDGYGFDAEFGVVCVRKLCDKTARRRGDKRAPRSRAQVEWDCSFRFVRRPPVIRSIEKNKQ